MKKLGKIEKQIEKIDNQINKLRKAYKFTQIEMRMSQT